jgi:hypothetical protein
MMGQDTTPEYWLAINRPLTRSPDFVSKKLYAMFSNRQGILRLYQIVRVATAALARNRQLNDNRRMANILRRVPATQPGERAGSDAE